MRSLERNKQEIKYSLYKGKIELSDDNGLPTGDFVPSYDLPKSYKLNVSANSANAGIENFGIGLNYTHVLSTTDMSCPINEESLIWYKGTKYCVVKVSKSLNSILFAIKEV